MFHSLKSSSLDHYNYKDEIYYDIYMLRFIIIEIIIYILIFYSSIDPDYNIFITKLIKNYQKDIKFCVIN